ncbi:MAG: PucR family transcriptional regulator [Baekduia sp.]
MTLGELLGGDLGLTLASTDPAASDQRVLGAHSIEIDHPGVWLERDWLMLTTGVRLRDDPVAQRRLVGELAEIGAAGLGLAEGIVFDRVPETIVEEADRVGLPVVAVPLQTAFRDVISAVNRAVLSTDVRALQRLSSLQLFLMDALDDDQPRRAVIQRLAEFTDAVATLFSAAGEVLDTTGPAPTERLWEQIRARPGVLIQFDCDGVDALATPLASGRGDVSWLTLTSMSGQDLARTARPAARAAAPVVAALARLDELAATQEQAVRSAVVDALVQGRSDEVPVTAAGRAAALGLDFGSPVVAIVLAGLDPTEPPVELVARTLFAQGVQVLAQAPADGGTLLAQGAREVIRAGVEEALARAPGWAAGIGRSTRTAAGVPASYRDAGVAAGRAAPGIVTEIDDLDVAAAIVADISPERLSPTAGRLLDTLGSQPPVRDAVVAYLEHDLDVMAAARSLHLHHNSLRHRLSRAEKLLGRPLKDPATITSLYVALAVAATKDG